MCFCGTVDQPQLAMPLVILAKPAGMWNSGCQSRAAGLEQQHRDRRVLAQPVGQHAAGRAAADDDVVVSWSHRFTACGPTARRRH